MDNLLTAIKLMGGIATAILTYLFGGFDLIFSILIALIFIDYITGVVKGIYQKQLSSEIGFRGIFRKIAILAVVSLAHMLGRLTGIEEIRSLTIGFYIANEGISILENAGQMGIPFPKRVKEVLQQLKDKE